MAGRHEFKLNNSTFYIRKYEAFLAIKILGDLQKQFLGPMALFFDNANMSSEAIAEGIGKVSRQMDGDTLVALAKKVLNPDFVSVAIGNDTPEKLTENMLNRSIDSVADVIELIKEVLVVNFAEIFT